MKIPPIVLVRRIALLVGAFLSILSPAAYSQQIFSGDTPGKQPSAEALAYQAALESGAITPPNPVRTRAPRITASAMRPGFDSTGFPGNDDGSVGPVAVGFDLNFFGVEYNQVYVNNNGNITFDEPLSTFTPFPLTTTSTKIIAPYFADVDTRVGNITRYGTGMVGDRPAFGVTWLNVGYFAGQINKLNTFQLILIDRSDIEPGAFDIEFNYEKVQWETGQASGGVDGLGGFPVRVGYANGGAATFELNGSAVSGGFLDSNLTTGLIYNSINSTVPGRYLFSVRTGGVTNAAPVANAGPNSQAATNAVVALYGGGSFDPEGAPVTYSWTQTDGPAVVITDATSATPTFTSPSTASTLTFQLAVNDGSLTSTDTTVVTIIPGVPIPSVGLTTVTEITPSSARFNAPINPNGFATTVHFEYGASLGYSNSTVPTPIGDGVVDVPFTDIVDTLTSNTRYHFRVVAINENGTAVGDDVVFFTGNVAPNAVNDTVSVLSGGTVLIDVLGNDSDADSDTFVIVDVGFPAEGTAVLESGQIRYTPTPGYFGPDSFTYTIEDTDGAQDTAFVNVTVQQGNTPPTISDSGNVSVTAGESTGPLAFTIGDAQTASASLIVSFTSSNQSAVPDSAVILGGSDSSRTVTINPPLIASGTSIITLTVSDGVAMTSDSFEVLVNAAAQPPTISDIADVMIPEDSTLGPIPFTVGDPDTALGSLIITASSSNQSLIPNGTLSITGTGADRFVSGLLVPNASGQATITVFVNDGMTTVSDTFIVTVLAINDPPTISAFNTVTINEDTSTAPLLFTVSDIDTALGSLTLSGSASNPAIVSSATGFAFGGADANRSVTVTPVADANGIVTITITVNDGDNDVTSSFTLNINALPDPATAQDATLTTDEDVALLINLPIHNPDSLPLTYLITGGPVNGILTGSGGTRTYTPNPEFSGTDSFTFQINDGSVTTSGTVNITIVAVDDPPTANADYAFIGLSTANVDVLANDTDIDSPGAVFTLVDIATQPTIGTASVVGTLVHYDNGGTPLTAPVTFQYTAAVNGLESLGTVTIYPPPASGTKYVGLITLANDSSRGRGLFNFTFSSNAVGTGSLNIDSVTWGFSGSVAGSPAILFAAGNAVPTIRLSMSAGAPDLNGIPTVTLTTTYNASNFAGVLGAVTPDPALVGKYTAFVDKTPGDPGPRSAAFLRIIIDANGTVSFMGKSGDANNISVSSALLAGGRVPFFDSYGKLGRSISGFVTFGETAPSVGGTLRWVVPTTVEPLIPTGIDQIYTALGNDYVAGITAFDILGVPTIGVNIVIPNSGINLNTTRNVNPASGVYIYGSVPLTSITTTPSTGFFAGQYYQGAIRRNYVGVVVQGPGLQRGEGYVLDGNTISTITLTTPTAP